MRKAILASVIGAVLFVVLIQPALGFVWKLVLSNVSAFSDLTYRHAALGLREENGFAVLVALNAFFFGVLTAYAASTFFVDSAPTGPSPQAPGRSSLRSFARSRPVAIFILLVGLAASILPLAVRFRDMQLNASFQQRLAVLAPHITDQQYKELVASWASMQTEGDYVAILGKMDTLAAATSVRLPSPFSGATAIMW